MAIPRYVHTIFYILYLITLAVVLWFLLYYSGVKPWVWTFFGVAILITIITVIMKEFTLTRILNSKGEEVDSKTGWFILYLVLNIISFILMVIGIIFVVLQSTVPWWVWLIIAIAIIISILTSIVFASGGNIIGIVMSVFSFLLFIAGIILVIIYSKSPWWVWLILIFAVLFLVMAHIFEPLSEKNEKIIEERQYVQRVIIDDGTILDSDVNLQLLPTIALPEQIVN